jgi:sugar lactone lactonase YvrE
MANLHVCSFNTNDVRSFDGSNGTFYAISFSGNGLKGPWGITVDAIGLFYIASSGSGQVLRFQANGTFDKIFASGNGLTTPYGLAFDSAGNLLVADGNQNNVLRFKPDGTFDKVFATGNGLNSPTGIAFGSDGKLYVANAAGANILRFNADGSFDQVLVPRVINPTCLTFDSTPKLYVGTTSPGTVYRYTTGGTYDSLFAASGPLWNVQGIVFGSDGNLYATSSPPEIPSPGLTLKNSSVLSFRGDTGAFDVIFASGGGLDYPTGLLFA